MPPCTTIVSSDTVVYFARLIKTEMKFRGKTRSTILSKQQKKKKLETHRDKTKHHISNNRHKK